MCFDSFKPKVAQEIMQNVLRAHLADKVYDPNESAAWTKEIAAQIKLQLKGKCIKYRPICFIATDFKCLHSA